MASLVALNSVGAPTCVYDMIAVVLGGVVIRGYRGLFVEVDGNS